MSIRVPAARLAINAMQSMLALNKGLTQEFEVSGAK